MNDPDKIENEDQWTKSRIVTELATVAENAEAWLEKIKDDKTLKPADLAKVYFYMDGFHDDVKAALNRLYHVIDAMDKFVLPTLLEHHGIDMVRVPEIKRSFSIRQMMTASIVDKEEGMKWLRENGFKDLIQETVNAGTLASTFRSMILDQGIDPPEEIFKVNNYKKISVTKYTPKPGVGEK
jgi:hypothetical protein